MFLICQCLNHLHLSFPQNTFYCLYLTYGKKLINPSLNTLLKYHINEKGFVNNELKFFVRQDVLLFTKKIIMFLLTRSQLNSYLIITFITTYISTITTSIIITVTRTSRHIGRLRWTDRIRAFNRSYVLY